VKFAQSVGVEEVGGADADLLHQAIMKRDKLKALHDLTTASKGHDVNFMLKALDDATEAGVDPRVIQQGQQKLERMCEVRRPAAKTNLLLATDGKDKTKLEAALYEARIVGVDKRLIEKGEARLQLL